MSTQAAGANVVAVTARSCLVSGWAAYIAGQSDYLLTEGAPGLPAIVDGNMPRLRSIVRGLDLDEPSRVGVTLLWFAMREQRMQAI
jgi:hypothetical protein